MAQPSPPVCWLWTKKPKRLLEIFFRWKPSEQTRAPKRRTLTSRNRSEGVGAISRAWSSVERKKLIECCVKDVLANWKRWEIITFLKHVSQLVRNFRHVINNFLLKKVFLLANLCLFYFIFFIFDAIDITCENFADGKIRTKDLYYLKRPLSPFRHNPSFTLRSICCIIWEAMVSAPLNSKRTSLNLLVLTLG